MKIDHPKLPIPIVLKLDENQPWPGDKVFYYLTRDGLFLCRNNRFFRSSSPVTKSMKGLASHKGEMFLNFPKLSQVQIEQIVGFFDKIWHLHNSEAAVLLVWNIDTEQVEIVCPPQEATVGQGYTDWKGKKQKGYPMDVRYEIPPMEPNQMVFGDVHSHVTMSAFASGMDEADEKTKPGVHIVVGKLDLEAPDFHVEATADGTRFTINHIERVVEKYEKRRHDFPKEWVDQVKIVHYKPKALGYGGGTYGGYYGGYGGHDSREHFSDADDGWSYRDGRWVKDYSKEKPDPKTAAAKKSKW